MVGMEDHLVAAGIANQRDSRRLARIGRSLVSHDVQATLQRKIFLFALKLLLQHGMATRWENAVILIPWYRSQSMSADAFPIEISCRRAHSG